MHCLVGIKTEKVVELQIFELIKCLLVTIQVKFKAIFSHFHNLYGTSLYCERTNRTAFLLLG